MQRAQIVLACAEGEPNSSIAQRMGLSNMTVGKWRRRYGELGLEGLHDELRPGRPRTHEDERVAEVINTALQARPPNATQWSVATGEVLTQCKRRHRHQEFLAFLRHIDANVPESLDIHLIVDNYATHKHPKVKAWLASRPRYRMHYTPTYASWINQVERWFGLITQQAIRRGSFSNVKELTRKINAFVEHYNAQASPFVWVATAESILHKIQRLCKVISGTHH